MSAAAASRAARPTAARIFVAASDPGQGSHRPGDRRRVAQRPQHHARSPTTQVLKGRLSLLQDVGVRLQHAGAGQETARHALQVAHQAP